MQGLNINALMLEQPKLRKLMSRKVVNYLHGVLAKTTKHGPVVWENIK